MNNTENIVYKEKDNFKNSDNLQSLNQKKKSELSIVEITLMLVLVFIVIAIPYITLHDSYIQEKTMKRYYNIFQSSIEHSSGHYTFLLDNIKVNVNSQDNYLNVSFSNINRGQCSDIIAFEKKLGESYNIGNVQLPSSWIRRTNNHGYSDACEFDNNSSSLFIERKEKNANK